MKYAIGAGLLCCLAAADVEAGCTAAAAASPASYGPISSSLVRTAPQSTSSTSAGLTCTADGFSAWGKDMGGYSSNPKVAEEVEATYHHSQGGYEDGVNVFDCKNDRGYEWWADKLVLEDPEYCASVAFTVGSWIEVLDKYSAG